jgi:endonuclease I
MLVARKWEKKVKKNQTTDKRKMDWKALQNSVNFILNSFRSNLCFIKFMLYLEHLNIYFSCGLNMMVDWKKKMVQIFEYHVHMIWKV